MRQSIFDTEDEIEAERDNYIAQLEAALHKSNEDKLLFTARWQLA